MGKLCLVSCFFDSQCILERRKPCLVIYTVGSVLTAGRLRDSQKPRLGGPGICALDRNYIDRVPKTKARDHYAIISIGNESVPKIIINNTVNLFLNRNQHFGNFKP